MFMMYVNENVVNWGLKKDVVWRIEIVLKNSNC